MLASELIKELEQAMYVIGDMGVHLFNGETLELKVEVLEEADMIIIRNKTKEESKEDKLHEAVKKMAKYSGKTAEEAEQQIKQMLSNGKMPMGAWLALQEGVSRDGEKSKYNHRDSYPKQ